MWIMTMGHLLWCLNWMARNRCCHEDFLRTKAKNIPITAATLAKLSLDFHQCACAMPLKCFSTALIQIGMWVVLCLWKYLWLNKKVFSTSPAFFTRPPSTEDFPVPIAFSSARSVQRFFVMHEVSATNAAKTSLPFLGEMPGGDERHIVQPQKLSRNDKARLLHQGIRGASHLPFPSVAQLATSRSIEC